MNVAKTLSFLRRHFMMSPAEAVLLAGVVVLLLLSSLFRLWRWHFA